jgi:5'-phosphate synthase pdxT subunit
VDGLFIPGGESTSFLKFLERDGFLEAVQTFVQAKPTFGTCAGCILLAKDVTHPPQKSLGVLDATVERNAYGRQIDSSIEAAETKLPGGPLEMVYIRAPRIVKTGDGVEVLAERDGFPVLVAQGHLMAATFHPELSADRRVHARFVDLVRSFSLPSR